MAILDITRTFTQDSIRRQRATSAGAEVSCILRATPGFLDSFLVTNNTGVAGYLQFHDAVALPANGAVPLFPPIDIGANESIGLSLPMFAAVGIVAAISTTKPTLTISTNAAFFYANCRN